MPRFFSGHLSSARTAMPSPSPLLSALNLRGSYCDTSFIYGGLERWSEQYFVSTQESRSKRSSMPCTTYRRTSRRPRTSYAPFSTIRNAST